MTAVAATQTTYNSNIRIVHLKPEQKVTSKWVKTGNFAVYGNDFGNGVRRDYEAVEVAKGNEVAWFVKATVTSAHTGQKEVRNFSGHDSVETIERARNWMNRTAQFMRFIVGNTVVPELKFANVPAWKPIETQYFNSNQSTVLPIITLNSMQTRPYGVEG